jgi:hypothetical protein
MSYIKKTAPPQKKKLSRVTIEKMLVCICRATDVKTLIHTDVWIRFDYALLDTALWRHRSL